MGEQVYLYSLQLRIPTEIVGRRRKREGVGIKGAKSHLTGTLVIWPRGSLEMDTVWSEGSFLVTPSPFPHLMPCRHLPLPH